jgi:hypothetical protein
MSVEGTYSSRETRGVRRQRSIEELSSSEGAHQKGADGSDAQTESGVEEPARQMPGRWGKNVRNSGVDRGDKRRGGVKIDRRAVAPFLRGGGGQQRGGARQRWGCHVAWGRVGPGSDRRAASRPRPGRDTHGPWLAVGERVRSGA